MKINNRNQNGRIQSLYEEAETQYYINEHSRKSHEEQLSEDPEFNNLKNQITYRRGEDYFNSLMVECSTVDSLRRATKAIKLKDFNKLIEGERFMSKDEVLASINPCLPNGVSFVRNFYNSQWKITFEYKEQVLCKGYIKFRSLNLNGESFWMTGSDVDLSSQEVVREQSRLRDSLQSKVDALGKPKIDKQPEIKTNKKGDSYIRTDSGGFVKLDRDYFEQESLKEYMTIESKLFPDYNMDVPQGKILLFHNTTQENAESIASEGILANKGRDQGRGKDGDFVWATSVKNAKGYGGYTIGFMVDKDIADKYKVSDTEYTLPFDIPAGDIMFIDEPIGLNSYRESDIKELVNRYGEDKVAEVLSRKTNLDSDAIGYLISKSVLNEANLQDLINDSKATDEKRIKLASTIYTDYKGVDSDGTLIFESDSQTRSGLTHRQRVFYPGFFDLLDTVDAGEEITEEQVVDIITNDLMVDCSCESFLYYAWAYKSWTNDYGLMKEVRKPQRNNVKLKGGACKHVLSVLDLINRSNTLFEQITGDLNTLFQKYKKRPVDQQANSTDVEQNTNNSLEE